MNVEYDVEHDEVTLPHSLEAEVLARRVVQSRFALVLVDPTALESAYAIIAANTEARQTTWKKRALRDAVRIALAEPGKEETK